MSNKLIRSVPADLPEEVLGINSKDLLLLLGAPLLLLLHLLLLPIGQLVDFPEVFRESLLETGVFRLLLVVFEVLHQLAVVVPQQLRVVVVEALRIVEDAHQLLIRQKAVFGRVKFLVDDRGLQHVHADYFLEQLHALEVVGLPFFVVPAQGLKQLIRLIEIAVRLLLQFLRVEPFLGFVQHLEDSVVVLFAELLFVPLTIEHSEFEDGLDAPEEDLLHELVGHDELQTLVVHPGHVLPPFIQPAELDFQVLGDILLPGEDIGQQLFIRHGPVLVLPLAQHIAQIVSLTQGFARELQKQSVTVGYNLQGQSPAGAHVPHFGGGQGALGKVVSGFRDRLFKELQVKLLMVRWQGFAFQHLPEIEDVDCEHAEVSLQPEDLLFEVDTHFGDPDVFEDLSLKLMHLGQFLPRRPEPEHIDEIGGFGDAEYDPRAEALVASMSFVVDLEAHSPASLQLFEAVLQGLLGLDGHPGLAGRHGLPGADLVDKVIHILGGGGEDTPDLSGYLGRHADTQLRVVGLLLPPFLGFEVVHTQRYYNILFFCGTVSAHPAFLDRESAEARVVPASEEQQLFALMLAGITPYQHPTLKSSKCSQHSNRQSR